MQVNNLLTSLASEYPHSTNRVISNKNLFIENFMEGGNKIQINIDEKKNIYEQLNNITQSLHTQGFITFEECDLMDTYILSIKRTSAAIIAKVSKMKNFDKKYYKKLYIKGLNYTNIQKNDLLESYGIALNNLVSSCYFMTINQSMFKHTSEEKISPFMKIFVSNYLSMVLSLKSRITKQYFVKSITGNEKLVLNNRLTRSVNRIIFRNLRKYRIELEKQISRFKNSDLLKYYDKKIIFELESLKTSLKMSLKTNLKTILTSEVETPTTVSHSNQERKIRSIDMTNEQIPLYSSIYSDHRSNSLPELNISPKKLDSKTSSFHPTIFIILFIVFFWIIKMLKK